MPRHKQAVAAALIAYAAWLTWKCPCEKTMSCHLPHYFLAVGGATAIILNDNM